MSDTKQVLDHHLGAFGAGNLDDIMADYSDDSVLFTQNGPLSGKAAIRGLFEVMFAEFAKPGASFSLDRSDVVGGTAYITWSAETADNIYELGTDTFFVIDGKIHHQTFAGRIVAKG